MMLHSQCPKTAKLLLFRRMILPQNPHRMNKQCKMADKVKTFNEQDLNVKAKKSSDVITKFSELICLYFG